jgi:hypothetical protein
MAKLPRKNMSLINCIKTKQHFIMGFRLRLNLYNLANLTLTQLTKPNLLIIRRNMKENQNGYPQSKIALENHFGIMEFMIS